MLLQESIPYTDAHTHPAAVSSSTSGGLPILRIVNASADNPPRAGDLFSVGIHPMRGAGTDFFEEVGRFAGEPGLCAVGECGLDRRSTLSLPDQIARLRMHLDFAETHRLPLILHAVRTVPELIRLKRDSASPVPWILHGFRGNARKASELLSAGFVLSFGAGLLRDEGAASAWFGEIPAERILLESDETPESLMRVYSVAAALRGENLLAFRRRIYTNFERIFCR